MSRRRATRPALRGGGESFRGGGKSARGRLSACGKGGKRTALRRTNPCEFLSPVRLRKTPGLKRDMESVGEKEPVLFPSKKGTSTFEVRTKRLHGLTGGVGGRRY